MSRIAFDREQDGLPSGRLTVKRRVVRRLCVAAAVLVLLVSAAIIFTDDQLHRRRANFIYGCEVAEVDAASCGLLADAYGYPTSIPRFLRYLYVRQRIRAFVPHLGK